MKRKLLFAFLTIFVVVALVGCKPKEKEPVTYDPNGELVDFSARLTPKTELEIWIDDQDGVYVEALIAAFNEIYPNVKVTHRHMGSVESEDRLKVVGPTGGGGDIFQFPHDHVATAVTSDLLLALPSNIVDLVNERSLELGVKISTVQYDPVTKKYGPDSGAIAQLYGLPTSIESVGLYYNKKLITEPHTTMESLLQDAAVWNAATPEGSSLTNAETGNYYLATSNHWADSYFMQPFYSAYGYTPFGPNLDDKDNVGLNSTAVINALNYFRTILKPATTGTGNHNSVTGGANFEAGRIPYIIAGPWNMESYIAAGVDFGVAQFPTININGEAVEMKTFAGAIVTAVYKYAKNQTDALRWIEFMNSNEAMQLLYDHKNKLPALKTELLSELKGITDNKELMAMSKQLETSVPMPTIPEVTHYWGPGETMITNAWNTDTSLADLAKNAEEAYETLVKLGGN